MKDALTEAQAIAGGGLSRTSSLPGSVAPGTGRKTVMLVDQDAEMRARIRAQLESFYDIVEARDGMEALEIAPTLPSLAMIVSETTMPRLDGFTLAKLVRNVPALKRVQIMFLSTRDSAQDVTQALVLGACQYVVKKTPVPEIVAKIRKIVV
ncbi:Chemotaxis regulator - transmits chemoreceptor signals to flagelllar motor components CheY [Labilithrix luteola]|uniref:Chemotaxis regulator-transmits chemoreceptor signals to flagelllar motor components CheY n=1 Tax=Labilithrix luteola TaxID=1391654 RepID=A0A0K1PNP9_9BACT|nr:Chemotaxis regulator - transmits chemoreceptor signals to flagelllar motor components CheY [Labilithrix luteola]